MGRQVAAVAALVAVAALSGAGAGQYAAGRMLTDARAWVVSFTTGRLASISAAGRESRAGEVVAANRPAGAARRRARTVRSASRPGAGGGVRRDQVPDSVARRLGALVTSVTRPGGVLISTAPNATASAQSGRHVAAPAALGARTTTRITSAGLAGTAGP